MCQKLHQLQPRRNLPRVRWWIRQSHLPETIQNSMCSLQQTRKKDCFESRYVQMPSRWARLFQLVSGFVLSKLIIILIMVIILRYWRIERKSSPPSGAFWTRTECQRGKAKEALAYAATRACYITGSPSSSCEMIILRNNSQGVIIRVCMGIFATALTTGGPSSSCEMIILLNNSHGGIMRVCMGIFTTALTN